MFLNTYPMSTYYSGLTLREYITGEKYDLSLDEFGSLSNGLFSSFVDLQTVNCANIEAVGKKCFCHAVCYLKLTCLTVLFLSKNALEDAHLWI